MNSETLKQAEAFISAALPAKAKAKVAQQFADHRAIRQAMHAPAPAPAQLGIQFQPIPQLCLNLDGYLEVIERNTLAELGDWSLLDFPVQLANFAIRETVNSFEIDVNGEKVKFKHIDAQQLKLNDLVSHVSEQDLIRWLDVQVRQSYVSQLQLQAYLLKMVSHLIHDQGLSLTALVRGRFQLADAIKAEIERLRQLAMHKGFQGRLFEMAVPTLEEMAQYSFTFDPGKYPARRETCIRAAMNSANTSTRSFMTCERRLARASPLRNFAAQWLSMPIPRLGIGYATSSAKSNVHSGCRPRPTTSIQTSWPSWKTVA